MHIEGLGDESANRGLRCRRADAEAIAVHKARQVVSYAILLNCHMNFSTSKNMLDLISEGMKWRCLQKISGNKVSAALVAVMCTTFVIWAWQKKPATFVLFPSVEQFNILSSVVPVINATSSSETNQLASVDGNSSVADSIESSSSRETEHSTSSSPLIVKSDEDLKEITLEGKECDYAKGKWVADTRRPFYSGSSCRQWLSPMWACRLMKRTDFSYESFRWQPQRCKMREFRRNEFFWRMQNKTIALVGDSLGRQQFQSLMCMVTGGEMSPEVQDVGKDYGLVKAPGALRPDGWAYRFPSTNTTILYYWSASLCELEPLNTSDPATHFALHLDRPATFLKQYLPRFDVLVLNTGHHWNGDKFRGNRWEMHAGGQPIIDGKLADLVNAKNLTLYSIARWVDSQILQHAHLKAFLRTMSPRHFVNGDWNTGGSCDNTVPLASGSQVLQDGSSDYLAEAAVKGTRVKLLDITALSQLRDEGHISKYTIRAIKNVSDCLHWCLPGIPDAWNEILYAQI